MNTTTKTALKWGLIIGSVNLIWLYAAYYLGLHTRTVLLFNVFMLIWLGINVTGYILALKALRLESASWSYWRGLGGGAIAAFVSALVAVVAQIGYFKVVHPAWPQYMVQRTKEVYEGLGLPENEVSELVEKARQAITLPNYAFQSAMSALILGIVLSAIIMIFLRRPLPKGEASE